MPYGEVRLIPGVNVERTPTLLEAGVSQSQLIRYKDTLVQKYGGWSKFYSLAVAGVPRDMHAWQDLNQTDHLSVGTTTTLGVITSGNFKNITPQTKLTDFAPQVQATSASTTITITDANVGTVTAYDAIYFNTPLGVGGLILSGLYAIVQSTGTGVYTITAASAAAQTNTLVTNATTAAGVAILNFASVPSWVVAGYTVLDITAAGVIPANTQVLSTGAGTVTMTANAAGAGVGSADSIVFVAVPVFSTTSGSAVISVFLAVHGLAVGETAVFPISTTGNGVTILGSYTVTAVTDANNFTITVTGQANATSAFTMNSGQAELLYYITAGPPAAGAGYGLGLYGAGGYGTGVTASAQTGSAITATDWTSDNWGQILLECPANGGVYQYDPTGGFGNASLITSAPPFNGGIFVSIAQQILICWASTQSKDVGVLQDPMLVKWSSVGDYTDFVVSATNQAGSFRIPIGSTLKGGMATGTNRNLLWTDLDLWAMDYIGTPFIYSFNKIGAGAGLISSHAAQQLRGKVFWMGASNFYVYPWSQDMVLPCSVWDFVFQNLNTTYARNVRTLPNTPFSEAGWAFPSTASTNGECDSYVKFNIAEPNAPWDYGSLARSAWIDQTVLGSPIGASPGGIIYQHESGNDADGQPLVSSFTTGYFYIAEGEEYAFVDQILPDFKWGLYGGASTAQVQITFTVLNYPGDSPDVYGPYTMTSSTEYISVRFRGRQMSVTVGSSDVGSFWRLGKIRYRYAPAGRR